MEKININNLNNLYKILTVLALIACVIGVIFAFNLFREGKLIGSSASNVISVTGKGEMDVKPDTSSITLTIRESGKDAKEGEGKISAKTTKFLASIKSLIEEKDIKTESYNSYPRYAYPVNQIAKIDGYEMSQVITLKVRDLKNVGKVLELITTAGINEVAGPNYEIDNIEKYKSDTRALAIKDAKEKVEVLAKQLGVDVVRIVSFSEGNDYVPPMYMRGDMMMKATMQESVPAPQLPVGENKVSSNVTITFEIK